MNWLEEIKEFNTHSEYEKFIKYLTTRLIENEIEEIEPKEYYQGKS